MYKKAEINRIVAKELRAGNKLAVALSKTELKTKSTYYVWMAKNPRLKKWVKALESLCDDKRTTMVEDAFFKRLIGEKATVADYAFYLSNRAPDRWQNNYNIKHSGEVTKTNRLVIVRYDGTRTENRAERETRQVRFQS